MDIRRVGIKVSNSMGRACERLQVGAAVLFESREVLRNLGPRFRYVAVVEVIKRAVIGNIKVNSINDRRPARNNLEKLSLRSVITQEGIP